MDVRNDSARRNENHHALALVGVLLLVGLELVAMATAPARDRAWISGALIGAGTSAFIVGAALLAGRRSAASDPAAQLPALADAGGWVSAQSLEGFPMEAVRPRLLVPGAPDLNRLYTAWALVAEGRDAAWVEACLELPADLTNLLVKAARERR